MSTPTTQPQTPAEAEARSLGFRPITEAYSSVENHMMNRAIEQLESGGIPYRLVRVWNGIEIWRQGAQEVDDE
jgi:hypothetical protein